MADLRPDDFKANLQRVAIPSQDLSAGPLSFVSSLDFDFRLVSVNLSSTAGITQAFSFSERINGVDYLRQKDSSANQSSFIYVPDEGLMHFLSGDQIKVDVTNTGTPAASISGYMIVEEI